MCIPFDSRLATTVKEDQNKVALARQGKRKQHHKEYIEDIRVTLPVEMVSPHESTSACFLLMLSEMLCCLGRCEQTRKILMVVLCQKVKGQDSHPFYPF